MVFSILLFNFVLFSPYYKFTSLEAHYHDESLSKWLRKVKIQKKRCLCCGSAASGWFGSLVLAILTSGCLSQIQVSPQQRPGQIGFCPRYNVQGEGAGAFLDSVLSCLQSSPVKQVFGSVKAMVRRDELLAPPRLCLK